MERPNLKALLSSLRLHLCNLDVTDTITQWLSHVSSLTLSIYQQHLLVLLVLPLLYFMLQPLTAGEDLHFMSIPMYSFCDDLKDHIACNANVLKHVREYFRVNFQATRRPSHNGTVRIRQGYWHMIPLIISTIILAFGTLAEFAISMTCTMAMVVVLITTTMLARDWWLQTVDWLDEGGLQTYRHVEETVERTFLDGAYWTGLAVSDVVIAAVNGREGKGGAEENAEGQVEQVAQA